MMVFVSTLDGRTPADIPKLKRGNVHPVSELSTESIAPLVGNYPTAITGDATNNTHHIGDEPMPSQPSHGGCPAYDELIHNLPYCGSRSRKHYYDLKCLCLEAAVGRGESIYCTSNLLGNICPSGKKLARPYRDE